MDFARTWQLVVVLLASLMILPSAVAVKHRGTHKKYDVILMHEYFVYFFGVISPVDCQSRWDAGERESGVYEIFPNKTLPIKVSNIWYT